MIVTANKFLKAVNVFCVLTEQRRTLHEAQSAEPVLSISLIKSFSVLFSVVIEILASFVEKMLLRMYNYVA